MSRWTRAPRHEDVQVDEDQGDGRTAQNADNRCSGEVKHSVPWEHQVTVAGGIERRSYKWTIRTEKPAETKGNEQKIMQVELPEPGNSGEETPSTAG